jgi:hypothetical protein
MPIPTHNYTCLTKAFRMECPECSAEVWFFSCTCGSKIFFNDLGHPWEQHICRKYFLAEQIKLIQNSDRLSDDEIYQLITKSEKKSGRIVDTATEEILESIIGKRRFPLKINECLPSEDSSDFAGKVMELNTQINIFKKFGYDPTNILSVKLLGRIGQEKWALAKIRTKSDMRNECLEYEVLLSSEYLRKNPFRKGDIIAGILDVVSHSKGIFWKLNDHKVI